MGNLIKKAIRLIEAVTNKKVVLKEALIDVQNDVDFIYSFFKKDIDEIKATNKVNKSMFPKKILDTSILTDELSKQAHEANPCEIYLNYNYNGYYPSEKQIYLSVNQNAFSVAVSRDSLQDAVREVPDSSKDSFLNEFSEIKLKGTINHELAHWISDSLYNKNIEKALSKKGGLTNVKGAKKQGLMSNINLHSAETEGVIHNILQAYKLNKENWNDISFADLTQQIPVLNHLTNVFKKTGDYELWKRKILERMAREGILGDKMKYDN